METGASLRFIPRNETDHFQNISTSDADWVNDIRYFMTLIPMS